VVYLTVYHHFILKENYLNSEVNLYFLKEIPYLYLKVLFSSVVERKFHDSYDYGIHGLFNSLSLFYFKEKVDIYFFYEIAFFSFLKYLYLKVPFSSLLAEFMNSVIPWFIKSFIII